MTEKKYGVNVALTPYSCILFLVRGKNPNSNQLLADMAQIPSKAASRPQALSARNQKMPTQKQTTAAA
jgi:hypothetical protein